LIAPSPWETCHLSGLGRDSRLDRSATAHGGGATWQLFIPPKLAYGERGAAASSTQRDPNFEVELVSIQENKEEKKQENKK